MIISTLSPQTVRSLTAGTLLMVVSSAWAQCLGHGRFSTFGRLINERKIWEDFLGVGLLCYPLVSFWSRHLLTSWNLEDVKVQIIAERMQFASHRVTGIVGLVLIILDLVIWAHAYKGIFFPLRCSWWLMFLLLPWHWWPLLEQRSRGFIFLNGGRSQDAAEMLRKSRLDC